MDKKTTYELRKITRGIPAKLSKNVITTVVDKSEEELVKNTLKRGNLNKEQHYRLSNLLASGAFRREEQIINEKSVKELDEYHKTKINEASREGKLADPSKDPFVRERLARLEKKK